MPSYSFTSQRTWSHPSPVSPEPALAQSPALAGSPATLVPSVGQGVTRIPWEGLDWEKPNPRVSAPVEGEPPPR